MRCLLFLLCLIAAARSQDALVTKRVFLKTPASYINLTSESWNVGGDVNEILVAVRFKAQSSIGQILALRAIRQDGGLEMRLELALLDGHLQIDLYNETGQNILIKPMTSNYMNHSSEHSVAVRINNLEKTLSFSIETRSENFAEIKQDIQWAGTHLVTTLGGGDRSLIGCISLMAVQLAGGSLIANVNPINQYEVEKCPTQEECQMRNCGEGTCLSLEVATCDCYGTGKTGPNCGSPGRTLELNNLKEDEMVDSWFQYAPWGEDNHVHRISMQFKFKDQEHRDGVLAYGKSLDEVSDLKMLVVNKLGTLHLGDKPTLSFKLAANVEFHHIELLLHKRDFSLTLTVDGEEQEAQLVAFPSFSRIYFGHAPSEGEAQEVGITACMKEVYVNHYDVINMIFNKDMRVSTSKPLAQCSPKDDDIIIAGSNMFPADNVAQVLPVDFMKTQSYSDENDILNTDMDRTGQEEDKSFGQAAMFPSPAQKKDNGPVPCEKSHEISCHNGATCVFVENATRCVCAADYGGMGCQFSLLPRSCSEASQFHGMPDGPNRMDTDGSGPLSPSVAVCAQGITTIRHDMPPATPLRDSATPTNSLYVVSYQDHNPDKLKYLIGTSGTCTQQVTYGCNHAPLSFANVQTWFRVATGNDTVKQLGNTPDSCSCLDSRCKNGGKCNCDSKGITEDMGVLKNEKAGVTSIVALYNEGDVRGNMTLGALECRGFAGEDKPIAFRKMHGLSIDDVRGQSISLHFRTADKNGLILSLEALHPLTVELVEGHALRLNHSGLSMTVDSQAPLSDTKWHLIILEWTSKEVRLSIDSSSSFGILDQRIEGTLKLNDEERGIVGCYRSVMIDQEVVDLHEVLREAGNRRDIDIGCADRCTPSTCKNSAECFEDFAKDAATCNCKYPNIQSGVNCETDINTNSSVSFHGGYLKYEKTEDPLLKQTVLSFRTDQAHALIFFAHDQNNNFIQLHLRDEVNLTLSLNNNSTVYSCTVRARHGKEFADMQWLQVSIDHLPSGSQLTVEEDACIIREQRSLSDSPVKEFTHWNDDLVTIPVGLEDSVVPPPLMYTFVGGVERHRDIRDGSKKMRPEYLSNVPDLLGCMRGLRIGGQTVDLRFTTHGYRPEDPSLVRRGCSVACGSLTCENGGHCSVAWKNYDPSVSKTTCDCSRTSYEGPSCTIDDGVTLANGQTFSFDMAAVLARYISIPSMVQTFKFSFSSRNSERQILANLYFQEPESNIEVILNKNSSVNVALTDATGNTMVHTFKGNFSDGYRHFIVFQLGKDSATAVMLDATRFDFPFLAPNLDLTTATLLVMGGQRPGESLYEFGPGPVKKSYEGCVSNVHLDLGINADFNFRPLAYLGNAGHSFSNYTYLNPEGPIVKGNCAPFRIPNQLPGVQNPVQLPAWETNFHRQEYTSGGLPLAKNEDFSWWPIIIGVILLILLIILVVLIICCCCCKKKEKAPANGVANDEVSPLNPSPLANEHEMMPVRSNGGGHASSNYRLPAPDMDLNNGEDISSDDDTERTLTPGVAAENSDNDFLLSRPTAFDRSVPHRMSSFRDPSVPRESPLWTEMAATPRRLMMVPPPVPPKRSPNNGLQK